MPEHEGPFDIWLARLSYDQFQRQITPGARIPLGVHGGGIHQTMPELTVSQDGPLPRIFVATWYDWSDVNCTVGGTVYDGSDWASARCYDVSLAFSTNLGVDWYDLPHAFPTVSDPALLPQRMPSPAGVPTERFLGDYHAVRGDLLHSAHVAITAPVGGPDELTNIERGWVSHGYFDNSQ